MGGMGRHRRPEQGGGGGAPLPERARSPELGIRALRCSIRRDGVRRSRRFQRAHCEFKDKGKGGERVSGGKEGGSGARATQKGEERGKENVGAGVLRPVAIHAKGAEKQLGRGRS